ncbi:hypothetical protein [Kocuria palustris]|uniref:hypothetical protein n=1 Tax=Kocuria palustris TaxID=71999 RepID=UPI0011A435F7|nr:hypothetical protein [Kocuria palustris]
MGFLSEHRAKRRDEREMGLGVWRRAHGRFRRGLDRFHQVLEQIQDPELQGAVVPTANELADLLPRVREICRTAQSAAPSDDQDIPGSDGGWLNDLHRELSRAGNDMAQAAEALALARFRAPGADPETARAQRLETVRRRAEAVDEHVRRGERLLAEHRAA